MKNVESYTLTSPHEPGMVFEPAEERRAQEMFFQHMPALNLSESMRARLWDGVKASFEIMKTYVRPKTELTLVDYADGLFEAFRDLRIDEYAKGYYTPHETEYPLDPLVVVGAILIKILAFTPQNPNSPEQEKTLISQLMGAPNTPPGQRFAQRIEGRLAKGSHPLDECGDGKMRIYFEQNDTTYILDARGSITSTRDYEGRVKKELFSPTKHPELGSRLGGLYGDPLKLSSE